MARFDGDMSPPFEIVEPAEWRAPIIFNSPHSGAVYPDDFLAASRIDLPTLRRSEDSFMDELIAHLAGRGFPIVRVNFPRSYVDVNREPYELDPRMFSGRLPSFANTRSMRVAGGLGTIPRVVGDGQEIYRDRIAVDDALERIEALYKPYHRALRRLINKAHQSFGTVILVEAQVRGALGLKVSGLAIFFGIVFLGGELMLWGLAALSFLEPKQTFGFWTILGGEHLFMLALGAVFAAMILYLSMAGIPTGVPVTGFGYVGGSPAAEIGQEFMPDEGEGHLMTIPFEDMVVGEHAVSGDPATGAAGR